MRKTVYSIQVLRAIAATMVVIYHSQALLKAYEARLGLPPILLNSTEPLRTIGASGVDLFFVISGFVMAYISSGKRESAIYIWPFLKRRLVRIVPVYWFYTTIMVGLLFLLPQLFTNARFNLWEAILSYLFIPYAPTVNPTAPILEVGWTLSYEMYFYLLVAMGLCLSLWRFALALGVCFCFCVFLHPSMPISGPITNLITNKILFEFFTGFLCGALYTSGFTPHKLLPPASLTAGITGYILWGMGLTTVPLGYFAVFIVAGSVFWEQQTKRALPHPLIALGDSSYSLYLSHYLLIPALGKACAVLGFWQVLPPWAFLILSVSACIIVGHILYLIVEQPLVRRLSNRQFLQNPIRLSKSAR